jgi:hypothetical protein
MEAMTKHRSHSAAFNRQVTEEFIAGETLHALSKWHDISRQLIRVWVGKCESGAVSSGYGCGRRSAQAMMHWRTYGTQRICPLCS